MGQTFPLSLCALWFFLEHWAFDSNSVTLEMRLSAFPRTCCFVFDCCELSMLKIRLRCKLNVCSDFFLRLSLDMCGHFLTFLVYQWFVNILVFNIWFLKEETGKKNVRGVKKGTASLFFKMYLLLYGCLGLCCCLWTFIAWAGATFSWGARTSHGGGFSCCGPQALGAWALVVVVHGLSCSVACGIFLEQGLNPCPLHWQADSHPLYHQGCLGCVCILSCFICVWLCVTAWTIAHQAPLSMGFPRQECWSGLPHPPLGDLPNPVIEPTFLMSPTLAGGFLTTSATWEAWGPTSLYLWEVTLARGGGACISERRCSNNGCPPLCLQLWSEGVISDQITDARYLEDEFFYST